MRPLEDFHSRTQITFDSMAPVEAAADMAVALLLNPERATRLVDYHSRDVKNPGLDEDRTGSSRLRGKSADRAAIREAESAANDRKRGSLSPT